MNNSSKEIEPYILSNKHIRLLDNIFRIHSVSHEVKEQILNWAAVVLSEEREEWAATRTNSIKILCDMDRKAEARQRAAARNKKYEEFKEVFKQLQEQRFKQYQKEGKVLTANAFVKWFIKNMPQTLQNPYVKSNQINQMTKLAQANNRIFKKAFECKS